MLKKRSLSSFASCMALVFLLLRSPVFGAADRVQEGEMAGYLLVPHEKVPETYNAGFSMYVAAWPLLKEYPGHRFQTGLFGTWMHAQYDDPDRPISIPISRGAWVGGGTPGLPPRRRSSSWAEWP